MDKLIGFLALIIALVTLFTSIYYVSNINSLYIPPKSDLLILQIEKPEHPMRIYPPRKYFSA